MSDNLLRVSDVTATCAISRATIYRRISAGTFPPPRDFGRGCKRWVESHVNAWKEHGDRWRSALSAEQPN